MTKDEHVADIMARIHDLDAISGMINRSIKALDKIPNGKMVVDSICNQYAKMELARVQLKNAVLPFAHMVKNKRLLQQPVKEGNA